MKQKYRMQIVALCLLLLLAAVGTAVWAQSSGGFNLEWHVIGGGGQESLSANFRVSGTVGQSLASPPTAASASYRVSSGYWFAETGTRLYLPVLVME